MTRPEPIAFTDVLSGDTWDELNYADVFPLMCPMTGHNCHSMCICYRDSRETDTRKKSDIHYRGDGYTSGECVHFGIKIDSDRD